MSAALTSSRPASCAARPMHARERSWRVELLEARHGRAAQLAGRTSRQLQRSRVRLVGGQAANSPPPRLKAPRPTRRSRLRRPELMPLRGGQRADHVGALAPRSKIKGMIPFNPALIDHLEESYAELDGALYLYRVSQAKLVRGQGDRAGVEAMRARVRRCVACVRKERARATQWGPRHFAWLDSLLGDDAASVKRHVSVLGFDD